ncbi:MAG: hypothetical protein K1X51_02945 [Rhodospirillaceae bacterium]|nr:hypothetical protein [Rhodospirillaceae bacterium]
MNGADAKPFGLSTLRATAAALTLALLGACAAAPQQAALDPKNGDGLGGTGISSGGIKTAQVNTRGDGIGGTGIGTGIVGTITGFGSIIVNGLELEFNTSTAVVSDGRPASLQDLRIGQVVQGIARTREGKLTLDTLDIQHAVTGPISAIDQATQTMTVLGQRVRLNLGGDKAAADAFKTLQAGDVVSVSGQRLADGTIIATRVDQKHDDGRVIVRGNVGALTATSVRVGELDVALSPDTTVSAPKAGGRVVISGRMINGQFAPDVINGGDMLPFGATVADVSLEAYAPANAGGSGPLNVHGVTITGAALPPGTVTNDRIIVTGKIDGPDKIAAAAIAKVRTLVTVLQAQGSARPAAVRPDTPRFERVNPPQRPERPQSVTPPVIERPVIERPTA